jgi:response regulator NasT
MSELLNGHHPPLRILVAEGRVEVLEQIIASVQELGHTAIAETDVAAVGERARAEHPDVAIVVVGARGEHALQLIDAIVREARCPVIAVLDKQDTVFVRDAAERGIFAYLTIGDDPQEVQSAIHVVLERFGEYHDLQGAFGRRATIERAKGVLMERHGVRDMRAFELLRDEARRTNRKIVDVAEAILASHQLLPAEGAEEASL